MGRCPRRMADPQMTASAPMRSTAFELHRALRYLLVGGMAAGLNWSSRFAWSLVLPFHLAVGAAYVTGMVFAFFMYRRFVFESSGAHAGRQVRNFLIVNALGIAQTWLLAMAMVEGVLPALHWTFQPEAFGHAVAVAAPTVTSWFGHRYFTFRAPKAAA